MKRIRQKIKLAKTFWLASKSRVLWANLIGVIGTLSIDQVAPYAPFIAPGIFKWIAITMMVVNFLLRFSSKTSIVQKEPVTK